jgi:hypothetical protein
VAKGVEAWLYRRLRTIPGLHALGSRVYPLLAPPGAALPFAIYLRKTTDSIQTLSAPLPYEVESFVVTLFERSYVGSKALSQAARDALNGFVGFQGGVDILFVEITSEADTLISADAGELLPFYGVELSITIKFRTN